MELEFFCILCYARRSGWDMDERYEACELRPAGRTDDIFALMIPTIPSVVVVFAR